MHSDSLGPMASMEKQLGDSIDARKQKPSSQARQVYCIFEILKFQYCNESFLSNRITNGGSDTVWMMGATLNPSSSVAKEMDACLKDEIRTHAAYDPVSRNSYHLPPLPRTKKASQVRLTNLAFLNQRRRFKSFHQPVFSDQVPATRRKLGLRVATLTHRLLKSCQRGSGSKVVSSLWIKRVTLIVSFYFLKAWFFFKVCYCIISRLIIS